MLNNQKQQQQQLSKSNQQEMSGYHPMDPMSLKPKTEPGFIGPSVATSGSRAR